MDARTVWNSALQTAVSNAIATTAGQRAAGDEHGAEAANRDLLSAVAAILSGADPLLRQRIAALLSKVARSPMDALNRSVRLDDARAMLGRRFAGVEEALARGNGGAHNLAIAATLRLLDAAETASASHPTN